MFKKATRKQSKLRMLITGKSGSGKTLSSLKIAKGLGGKIAMIDTEHGKASLYAGVDGLDFDVVELDNFHPKNYIDAIQAAISGGYDILIIDSLSHAWKGKGGVLEQVDKVAKSKYKGNSYNAWNEGTRLQDDLIEVITSAPIHIIATVRSKMDYVQEKNESGKTTISKVGLAPIQRDDTEYEFDIVGDMVETGTMLISKARSMQLMDKLYNDTGDNVAKDILTWLSDGDLIVNQDVIDSLDTMLNSHLGMSLEQFYTDVIGQDYRPETITDNTIEFVKRAICEHETPINFEEIKEFEGESGTFYGLKFFDTYAYSQDEYHVPDTLPVTYNSDKDMYFVKVTE